MAEIYGPNQLRPVATPEQERAFIGMTDTLFRQAFTHGRSIHALGVHAGTVEMVDEDYFDNGDDGMVIEGNARLLPRTLYDAEGQMRHSFVYMMKEEGIDRTGITGSVVINDSCYNSHPANMFLFYPDYNVEMLRRTEEHDGYDEEDYPINWREQVEHVGWLNAEAIEQLQQIYTS
jgi:hypothetical protein